MQNVRISDITLKQKSSEGLSFKEKIELARLLDRLCVDVIELDSIKKEKADSLYIKTVADAVTSSTICVESPADKKSIDTVWEALKGAKSPRIQITCPVSLVQMEYVCHAQPDKMLETLKNAVAHAASLCDDVEFCALDASRADKAFLCEAIDAASNAGAKTVTLCDDASIFLPDEFAKFVQEITQCSKAAKSEAISVGIKAGNAIAMADACSIAAARNGASEIKVSVHPVDTASLKSVVNILKLKGSEFDLATNIRTVEIDRVCEQADRMFTLTKSSNSPFENGVNDSAEDDDVFFTAADSIETITEQTRNIGYDLSDEDQIKVYEHFKNIAAKKNKVSAREIDAIVASSAMQVTPAYKIEDYIINAGSVIAATAHIRLERDGEIKESVAIGDGPVDAAFLAIEQIAGTHYELDDFQIRSVTEGREAMGEAVVKLRSNGKLYSGRGLSTDIIGSSIRAYINALNKIVYEEESE